MGKLFVIGVSTGNYEDLTIKAYNTLKNSDLVYCDEKMYLELSKYLDNSKLIKNGYTSTRQRCINAINSSQDKKVSIVGSGDTGIYGISSIIIDLIDEMNPNLEFEIVPGVTSFLSASSKLGSPITRDFAVISLSNNFDEQDNIRKRIEEVAKTNMVIVFYSPTYENLMMAKEILLKYRKDSDYVGIVSNIGKDNEEVSLTNIAGLSNVEAMSTIIVGNNETSVKVKKLTTPLY